MPKKMRKKNSTAPKSKGNSEQIERNNNVAQVLQYKPPVYCENGAGAYIDFMAFDPVKGAMRRKTIKLNHIKGIKARRDYARESIKRLTHQLSNGWNPWVMNDSSDLNLFEDALTRYETHVEKMLSNGYFRKETYNGYKSNIKVLREYAAKKNHIYYLFQFNRKYCVDFLDYIFIDRNNGAQTRNNYLNFLRVFSGFLVEKGLLKTKPTEGIAPINRRLYTKERECIPPEVVGKIAKYCMDRDPHFLFACYLLYYCFIRPVEMTRLLIKHFNIQSCTLTIPGSCSKNKMTQTVTIPKKVLLYGISIGVFSAPGTDHVFSIGLKPGKEEIDTKLFRDHWAKVRKALRLKPQWKFYSLKDTGITEMCDNNMASIAVRDQARHSSLAITDIYTRHRAKANKDIIDMDGSL